MLARTVAEIREGKTFHNYFVPAPMTWTPALSLASSTRTITNLLGDGSKDVLAENEGMAVFIYLFWINLCSRTFATLEIPTASLAWYLPIILYLKGLTGVFVYDFDKCAWGKRPWDRVPNEGDVRVKAPTRIITKLRPAVRLGCDAHLGAGELRANARGRERG